MKFAYLTYQIKHSEAVFITSRNGKLPSRSVKIQKDQLSRFGNNFRSCVFDIESDVMNTFLELIT